MADQDPKELTKSDLLKSFHDQFAENQNHHQTVFIQFISAVIVVITGYAIVYTNTLSDANFYFAIKEGHDIKSYAIIHLIGAYLTAENILALVCILTVNIGYGFRRDQMVNFKIRKYYLGEENYQQVFGVKSFNPSGKSFFKFLPEFNMIFTASIVIIQSFLIFSILYALFHFKSFTWDFKDRFFSNTVLLLFIIAPLITTISFYAQYYKKYKIVTGL